MKDKEIDRKIYYYDVQINKEEGNKVVSVNDIKEASKLIMDIFKRIKGENDTYDNEKNKKRKKQLFRDMCLSIGQDTNICIIVDEIKKQEIYFRILMARDNALPYIEFEGSIEKLTDIITADFNMIEITHCVLFVNSMILGAEFNFNGARASMMATYISMKYEIFVKCKGKIKNEIYGKMIEDGEYTLLKLSVRNNVTMQRLLIDRLGIIGRYFEDIGENGLLEVKLSRRRNKKHKGFKIPWKNGDELSDFVAFNKDDIKSLKLRPADEQDPVDVLCDKLVHTVKGISTENRVIDSKSMYNEIIEFYNNTVVKENEE